MINCMGTWLSVFCLSYYHSSFYRKVFVGCNHGFSALIVPPADTVCSYSMGWSILTLHVYYFLTPCATHLTTKVSNSQIFLSLGTFAAQAPLPPTARSERFCSRPVILIRFMLLHSYKVSLFIRWIWWCRDRWANNTLGGREAVEKPVVFPRQYTKTS